MSAPLTSIHCVVPEVVLHNYAPYLVIITHDTIPMLIPFLHFNLMFTVQMLIIHFNTVLNGTLEKKGGFGKKIAVGSVWKEL